MDISYIINELGEEREKYFNAIAPPIVQTSNFAFDKVDDLRKLFEDEKSGYIYSRGRNPTVDMLCKKLAALDGAEDALAFNSGTSAICCAVMANVKAGDHIISVKDPYGWADKLFKNILPRFGVETTFIDGRDINNFHAARKENTALIYLESPNSWDFAIQDLRAVAALAKAHSIVTVCDNTHCSPLYQRPLEMGIDLVLQSASKYISGHSDTVAGVLSGSRDMIKKIFLNEYNNTGSGIQPFNAWLLLRGLRTLPLRLAHLSKTAEKVCEFLIAHPRVESVLYPFHPSFPQYELAKRQMSGNCGLMTFVMKAQAPQEIEHFCESLKHILMAVSWGGHESLIIPKCAFISHDAFDPADPMHRSLRLYAGLEDPDLIIDDLRQAFDALAGAV